MFFFRCGAAKKQKNDKIYCGDVSALIFEWNRFLHSMNKSVCFLGALKLDALEKKKPENLSLLFAD